MVLLAVTQEQHADRCALYSEWKGFEFPILHDPINLMRNRGVPMGILVDERGVVRSVKANMKTLEADFLDQDYYEGAIPAPSHAKAPVSKPPDLKALEGRAREADSGAAWREYGDGLALWGGEKRVSEAIEAYENALKHDASDADSLFRLGVCYRSRSETALVEKGDFQCAVDHWADALALDPNQYIWRRRIEQYGSRLAKPYPFYDWVQTARADIEARGGTPPKLRVEPTGSELAEPLKSLAPAVDSEISPDPKGRIFRDEKRLIRIDSAVAPPRVRPGGAVRIHLSFRPDGARESHWNNQAEPLRFWIDPPEGWRTDGRLLTAAQGRKPETAETRRLDFEIQAPPGASGKAIVKGYALYYVCEGHGGACYYLRQDLEIELEVTQ